MDSLIMELLAKIPGASLVLPVLGALVVIGQVVVALTPSKADDAAWDKLKAVPLLGSVLSVLANFAPIQKK